MTAPLTPDDLAAARLVEQLGFVPLPATVDEARASIEPLLDRPQDTDDDRRAFLEQALHGVRLWQERPDEVAAALAADHASDQGDDQQPAATHAPMNAVYGEIEAGNPAMSHEELQRQMAEQAPESEPTA